MKKSLFVIAIVACAALFFTSCKSEKKEKLSMKPETTKISGDLSECFEVVDEDVVVKLKDGSTELGTVWRVKVRRTDAPLPFEDDMELEPYGTWRTDGTPYYNVGFGLRITGGDGDVVQENKATEGGLGGPYSSDDVKALLKLKPGEVGEIRWSVDDDCLGAEEPMKFTISTAFEESKGSTSRSSSSFDDGDDDDDDDDDEVSSTTSSSTDWDAFLDDYEEYIDNYIALMKKAKNGDMSAMSEYSSMLSKAQSMQTKLDKAQGEMTSAQIARYTKLNAKLAKAAY